ncbi:MAG: hypothetical protein KF886_18950 [Candidatus Hydrogenedentes bacterium]|nr:hypothetical protein [Candidatus Hydrogenedentota bacterium]
MTNAETTAEGFLAVLKALPKSERDDVILRIARDKEIGRDLVDLAIVAEREDEPSRRFGEYAGQPFVLPLAKWEQVLEELEDLDDIRAYDAAKSESGESVPFDQAVCEIRDRYGE